MIFPTTRVVGRFGFWDLRDGGVGGENRRVFKSSPAHLENRQIMARPSVMKRTRRRSPTNEGAWRTFWKTLAHARTGTARWPAAGEGMTFCWGCGVEVPREAKRHNVPLTLAHLRTAYCIICIQYAYSRHTKILASNIMHTTNSYAYYAHS